MTDPTPHDPAVPAAAQPSLSEALGYTAAADALKTLGERAKTRQRADASLLFLAAHEKDGTAAVEVRVPSVGVVGKASIRHPHPVAHVTDGEAYLEYVARTRPTEIEHTVVITLDPQGFGVGGLVKLLRDVVAEHSNLATITETRAVRSRFQAAHMEALASDKLVAEEPDPKTGEEAVVVPGVTVTRGAPNGDFSITGVTTASKARILEAMTRGDVPLARVLGIAPATPAVEDGRTIPGEEVEPE